MGQALDALGINLPQLVAQVVNFFVLLVILRFTLFKPVLGMLDKRRERIEEGINAAEVARQEAEAAQVRMQQEIRDAQAEAQQRIAQAQDIAVRLESEAREEAAREREVVLQRARADIERERDRAIADLRSEFAGLTVSAAERVINQSLDHEDHQRIINETLADSRFGDN